MADTLSATLEELQQVDKFDPPDAFREQALVRDRSLHEKAASDPEGWWAEQAEALHWFEKWDEVLDESEAPFYKWFTGGKLNASYNALDRHVEAGRGDKVAFHWRGEEGEERDVSYSELLRDVKRLANVLKERGIKPGDVVGIYLPMIPEVAVAMLACARLGAVHTVVFGGFAADALRDRIHDSQAKLVITQDGAYRRGQVVPLKATVDKALAQPEAKSATRVVVYQHLGKERCEVEMTEGRDVFWHDLLAGAAPACEPTVVDAEHPLFILYTSGSTGKPKGVLHTTAGYLVGVHVTTKYVFDLRDDDVYWCTADIGWVTGHFSAPR